MKLFILSYFLIFYSTALVANDSIVVDMQLKNSSSISKWEDLSITLKIRNESFRPLLISHYESWGVPEDGLALFIVEVQKLSNGKYTRLKSTGTLDNLVIEGQYDTVAAGDQKKYDFHFGGTFQFGPGAYRIRVHCRFSRINTHNDSFSQWSYFSVKNRIKRPI